MALRRRRVLLLVTGAGLLVAAGVAAALLTITGRGTGQHESAAQVDASPQLTSLQLELNAPSVRAEAKAVAIELRAHFLGGRQRLLAVGSHLRINPASFRSLSPRLGTVDAVVTGSAPRQWRLVLIREEGRWLLLSTRKLL